MKTTSAFFTIATAIASLFGVHGSRAANESQDLTAIRPFTVPVVAQSALDDLRRRVAATRWPEKETVADQSQGVQFATMQKLASYWAKDYDWRECEKKLKALPHFVTNRHDFAKLIWKQASPKWNFDDTTFDRSAAAFDNPDHVDIAIHNYRWRLALAQGEPKYDDLEKRLAESPVITVPTITLEGDANGAPHPDPSSYAKKFSGKYEHRDIKGGIGHNLPQEASEAFAKAVIDVDRF
jgi:pimeloyl-ACP methyl ester carboxylesterase